MSSKVKARLSAVLEENREMKMENQRLKRTLAAAIYAYGTLKITYVNAAKVKPTDQIKVKFNKHTGIYTVEIKERDDDSNRLGSGSEEVGLPGGEGDVGGSLSEVQPEPVGDEVRKEYQQYQESD